MRMGIDSIRTCLGRFFTHRSAPKSFWRRAEDVVGVDFMVGIFMWLVDKCSDLSVSMIFYKDVCIVCDTIE